MAERRLDARITVRGGQEAAREVRGVSVSVQDFIRSTDAQSLALDQNRATLEQWRQTLKHAIRDSGAQGEILETLKLRLRQVDEAMRFVPKTTTEVAKSSRSAASGVGTLRSAMGSLAATSAGLPGRFGEIASIMTAFSIGSLTSAGIFAGLAAIGLAFREITRESREAKEAVEDFVNSSPTLRDLAGQQQEAATLRRRAEILSLLGAGGRTTTVQGSFGPGSGTEIFTALSDRERENLTAELFRLNRALGDTRADRITETIQEMNARIPRIGAPTTPDLSTGLFSIAANPAAALEFLAGMTRAPAPVFTGNTPNERIESVLSGLQGSVSPEQALGGLGQIGDILRAAGMTESDLIPSFQRTIQGLKDIAGDLGDVSEDVGMSGKQLVGAFALAANGLAGMITGRTSFAGGLGSILGGLANIPALAGAASGLGFASIGLSFIDALTSDRNKDTMAEAHLRALREHEKDKPQATIIVNVDPFDPTNRNHQRIIDEARREAQAAGYRVDVKQG